MSVVTQGTEGYILVRSPSSGGGFVVMPLGCVTSFDPGADSTDQIEDTCLSVRGTRTYQPGLTTPGAGSIGLNIDPDEASHLELFELSKTKEIISWAVGWSDGTTAPTVNGAGTGFNLPTGRTWNIFDAYVSGFPFNFAANTVVQATVGLQRRGELLWYPKVP